MIKSKASIQKIWNQTAQYHTLCFFFAGFIFDVLTLEEVDDTFTLLSQCLYLLIALGFFLLNSEKKLLTDYLPRYKFFIKISEWRDEIFHFCLGALLNAFILYFFKSSTFLNSFILLIFLSGLLWLNEFRPSFLKHDLIPVILVHTCLLSFSVILAPTLIGSVGVLPFSLGLIFYLGLVSLWIYYRKRYIQKKWQMSIAATLAAFFLTLYVFRVFPPVPLSLKNIGVYHKIEKVSIDSKTRYMTFSSSPWWNFWNRTSTPFHARPSDSIYVFTRVFAPSGFSDTVYIEWWWRARDEWLRTDRIPLEITGGRREGYRGFTYKSNYDSGLWRVVVTTSEGLEIGRTTFEVENVSEETDITLYDDTY